MARSVGSLSTTEAKNMSKELEQIIETPYKYNFSILRVVELLICQRVVEQLCKYDDNTTLESRQTVVEIPLLGDLKISPRYFHEQHRLTDESSIHFNFEFVPTNCFRTDLLKAYLSKESPLADTFANIYGERLKELYSRLEGGEIE
jgi:hypothetical protein